MTKYKQVYQDIKEQITSGIFPAQQALPSENELMAHYAFSKDTIRKALSLLEMHGYIQKQQGRNAIVLAPNLTQPQQLAEIKTVSELNYSATHLINTQLTNLCIVQGDPVLMETFQVDQKVDFYQVGRTREIDGEKIEYEISYFDRRIVPYISREIAEKSIYQYLEQQLGLEISHSKRKISFRYANAEEKRYMDLAEYNMVIEVTSMTYLANGQPFQYGSISYRPDKISFTAIAKR